MTRRIVPFELAFLVCGLLLPLSANAAAAARFDALYGELLERYWRPPVTIHGIETTVFDYAAMQREATGLLAEIAGALAAIDPTTLGDRNRAKAFWINAYNFAAMRMVIEAYPVDSITSFKISLIRHPWSQRAIRIGNRDYSLSEIEKEILLARFNDARIIFAVSCAAVSCPDRAPEIFDGERLDSQLDGLIRGFLRNPGKGLDLNRDRQTLTLSWIFDKDGHLFEGFERGAVGFVMPYLEDEQRRWLQSNRVAVDYFEHDWTLNDSAQADPR